MSLAAVLGLVFIPLPWFWGTFGLLAALHIFFHALGISLSIAEAVLVLALVSSVPFSAWLAGCFVDRFAFGLAGHRVFSMAAVVVAFSLFLDPYVFASALRSILRILTEGSWGRQAILLASIGNTVIFCAGVTAMVLMTLIILAGLPFIWFSHGARAGVSQAFLGLRPVLVILAACLVFGHVSGLFADELSPGMLIHRAWGG